MGKILSLIVPTYNMERYLSICLDSIIVEDHGTLHSLEVLVVNDGSKDKSLSIAREYEKKYSQTFRIIDKENGNYGSCINRGLEEASGKYVKVLDADDYFTKKNFEAFLRQLEKIDADLILSSFNMVDIDGNIIKHISYDLPIDCVFDFSQIPSDIDMWMHAVTYRTEMLRELKYHQTEGISYTDQEWIFTPMCLVRKVYYFSDTVYNYLVGRDGQTIDKVVFVKNIWQEMKGLEVMASEYNCILKKDSERLNNCYLLERLKARISTVYAAYIYRYRSKLDASELEKLDKRLQKESILVYNLCNEVIFHQKLPIRYVQIWRNGCFLNSILFLLLQKVECYIENKNRHKIDTK